MSAKTLEEDNKIRARQNNVSLTGQMPWLDTIPTDFVSILDVGCGSGYHSKYFQDRGHDVTAVDYDMNAFEFHGEVRAIESGLYEYQPEHLFDAVICSHVLEHFPNTTQAFKKVRSLLKPNGYLFVIVPGYTPFICNGHWNIGWNVAQLGGLLVSSGFDCTQSTFAKLGINVCGFGRKSEAVPVSEYGFTLPIIVDNMPAPFRQLHGYVGPDELVRADISWLDPDKVVELPKLMQLKLLDFRLRDIVEKGPIVGTSAWTDRLANFEVPLDLSGSEVHIVTLVEGPTAPIRLIMGSGRESGSFTNNADYWNEYPNGVSTISVSTDFLLQRGGKNDWSKIDQIGFGGPIPEGTTVYFGIFGTNGQALL